MTKITKEAIENIVNDIQYRYDIEFGEGMSWAGPSYVADAFMTIFERVIAASLKDGYPNDEPVTKAANEWVSRGFPTELHSPFQAAFIAGWAWEAKRKALSTLPIAGGGKVKALEWDDLDPATTATNGSNGRRIVTKARHPYGLYTIEAADELKWYAVLGFVGKDLAGPFTTIDVAKAVAQADYQTRILSALISSPGKDGGQEVEAVGEQWRAIEDGSPKTSWYPVGYGDEAGWKAIAKRHPEKYQVVTRPVFAAPSPQSTAVDHDAEGLVRK